MDSDGIARTTPHGRRLILRRLAQGQSVITVAASMGVTALPPGVCQACETEPPGAKAPSGLRSGPSRGGGNKTARRTIHEDRVVKAAVPPGSRFKGHQTFVVQGLVLRANMLRLRRECSVTPHGPRITAAMPAGISGHFGPELRRFVLLRALDRPEIPMHTNG